ncbi:MAG: fibronectin type III domain-containing protein, partial [Thermoanaerobaculia bacterium]
TPGGDWPRNIEYAYSGERVGGTLVSTAPNDRPIYTPEKVSVTALFLRTAELAGDATLRARGEEMVQVALSAAAGEGAPLGKLEGQLLGRLHAAVARVANQGGSTEPPPPPPPPPPGDVLAPTELVATAVSTTEIKLTWKDNSTNEDNFLLEKISNGVFKQFKMTGSNITSVKITGLTPGTGYTFRVRAATSSGTWSDYSNTATASTP